MNNFGFSIYGPNPVEIFLESWPNKNPGPNQLRFPASSHTLLEEVLLHRCFSVGPEFSRVKDIFYKYELSSVGYGYFYFENRSDSQRYYIAIQVNEAMINCQFSRMILTQCIRSRR